MSEPPEDPTERARKYVENFETAKAKFDPVNQDTIVKTRKINQVRDAIERYLNDARYYLENGKSVTALASIAYAEGLMDALSFLELTKTSNVR